MTDLAILSSLVICSKGMFTENSLRLKKMEVDTKKVAAVWEPFGPNGKKDRSAFNITESPTRTSLVKLRSICPSVMDSSISLAKHKLVSV